MTEPDKKNILDELDRIMVSDDFRTKPILKKLLHYLVTESVEGRSDQISGSKVGIEVFGEGSRLDPDRGSLVRNNAVRLRSVLKTYYLGEGSNDPIRINIPKGRYVPHYTGNDANSGDGKVSNQLVSGFAGTMAPRIGVGEFPNNTSNPNLEYLCSGFSRELADALTKFGFRIIALGAMQHGAKADVDYLIDGEVLSSASQVKIHFSLVEVADGSLLWGDGVKFDAESDDLFDIQEKITERVASLIGGEYGCINQHRYEVMLSSRPQSIAEQDMMLKHYHRVQVLSDESVTDFHQDIMLAYEANPSSALLTALAGGIYNNMWMYSGSDDRELLQKSATLAEKAYQLNPHHQEVISNLATKCFHFDERERFFALFENSREWMANSPLRLGSWAMYISFFGEWEFGKKLLDKVFENNLNIPLWLYGVTCMYFFRNGDYDSALNEVNKYQIPGLFWGPAYRCAMHGHMGRPDEARKEFDILLEWRPDFVKNGRRLMGRLHKEIDLLDQVIDGFEKAGLGID